MKTHFKILSKHPLLFSSICSANGKRYRYGFNGKEKDNETYGEGNAYDFGARIYDSRLGRWLALDPLMAKYISFSPYVFVLNTPLQASDPDGERVVFKTEKEANKVANDVNKIYQAKYGVANAISVNKKVTKVQVLVNPVIWSKPSTWGRVLQKDKYEEKEVITYELKTNDDFKWTTDIYTSALFDVINDNAKINISIVPDANYKYGKGFIEGLGGGFTNSPFQIDLSDGLSQYGDEGTTGAFPNKWTLGGVFLHEILYHIHELGKEEERKGGPNLMRIHYSSKTGGNHPAGTKQSIKETEKLKTAKNKTGTKNKSTKKSKND